MHTATDYTVMLAHTQRVDQAERILAWRLLADARTIAAPRGRVRDLVRGLAGRLAPRQGHQVVSWDASPCAPERGAASR